MPIDLSTVSSYFCVGSADAAILAERPWARKICFLHYIANGGADSTFEVGHPHFANLASMFGRQFFNAARKARSFSSRPSSFAGKEKTGSRSLVVASALVAIPVCAVTHLTVVESWNFVFLFLEMSKIRFSTIDKYILGFKLQYYGSTLYVDEKMAFITVDNIMGDYDHVR
jgi:hypothetical protein